MLAFILGEGTSSHKVPNETQLVDHMPFFILLLGIALTIMWLGRMDI